MSTANVTNKRAWQSRDRQVSSLEQTLNPSFSLLCLLAIMVALSSVVFPQDKVSGEHKFLLGNWTGVVNAGSMRFTFVFKFREDEKLTVRGTMDILEQDAKGLPIQDIVLKVTV